MLLPWMVILSAAFGVSIWGVFWVRLAAMPAHRTALVALFLLSCGSEFSGTPPSTSDAGAPSTSDAGAGAASSGGQGGAPSHGGASGGPPAAGGADAGAAGASGPSCTPLQRDKPSMPKRCQTVQNKGCDAGATCITLEERSQPSGLDYCIATGITTSCADSGCLEGFSCACLKADLQFDKTGLETRKCCDTASGPLYVLPPLTCP